MPTKKYRIRLTTDEQQELKALVSRGRTAAYKQTHARILLMSDEAREDGGMKDADISGALGCGAVNGRAGVPTLCRGRHRVGVEPQKATAPPPEDTGRRGRSQVDSDGLWGTAARSCEVDPEAVG